MSSITEIEWHGPDIPISRLPNIISFDFCATMSGILSTLNDDNVISPKDYRSVHLSFCSNAFEKATEMDIRFFFSNLPDWVEFVDLSYFMGYLPLFTLNCCKVLLERANFKFMYVYGAFRGFNRTPLELIDELIWRDDEQLVNKIIYLPKERVEYLLENPNLRESRYIKLAPTGRLKAHKKYYSLIVSNENLGGGSFNVIKKRVMYDPALTNSSSTSRDNL